MFMSSRPSLKSSDCRWLLCSGCCLVSGRWLFSGRWLVDGRPLCSGCLGRDLLLPRLSSAPVVAAPSSAEGGDDAAYHGRDAHDRRDDAARYAYFGGVSVLTRLGRCGRAERTRLVWLLVSALVLTDHLAGRVRVQACTFRGSFDTHYVTCQKLRICYVHTDFSHSLLNTWLINVTRQSEWPH